MRIRRRIIGAALAAALAGGLALGVASAASAAAPTQPEATAHLIRTEIEANGWCLTAQPDIRDGEAVVMVPCTNNVRQLWLCGEYRWYGFCSPVAGREILDLGQRGREINAILVSPHVRGSKLTLSFTQLGGHNNWILGCPYLSRQVALQFPRIRRAGEQYYPTWRHNGAYAADLHFTGNWYAA